MECRSALSLRLSASPAVPFLSPLPTSQRFRPKPVDAPNHSPGPCQTFALAGSSTSHRGPNLLVEVARPAQPGPLEPEGGLERPTEIPKPFHFALHGVQVANKHSNEADLLLD